MYEEEIKNEIEIEENTDLATIEVDQPEKKSGINVGGVLAGLVGLGVAAWGAKKLFGKDAKEARKEKKLAKAKKELEAAGYHVCELDPDILEIPVVEDDFEETDE